MIGSDLDFSLIESITKNNKPLDSSIPEENKPTFRPKPIPEVEYSKPKSEPVKIKTTGLY